MHFSLEEDKKEACIYGIQLGSSPLSSRSNTQILVHETLMMYTWIYDDEYSKSWKYENEY